MEQKAGVEADICLILEGSYPYVSGGVSSWTHELIQEHKERTFSIYSIMPPGEKLCYAYTLPKNVVDVQTITIQSVEKGAHFSHADHKRFSILQPAFEVLLTGDFTTEFEAFAQLLIDNKKRLGRRILVESQETWKMIVALSQKIFPKGPFLDFFWSLTVLGRALYSISLPPLPKAKIYHALSTGYAGYVLSQAKKETKRPCLLTEHGIYTTERRIEISISEWFKQPESLNLSFDNRLRTMRDFWLCAFLNIAHICYQSADEIITLFEGNKETEISQGAAPEKIRIIANGVDYERYARYTAPRCKEPTIALIGRIVPIKDTKTFIRACHLLKERLPNLHAYLLGPNDENPEYFDECLELIEDLDLKETVEYHGPVELSDYLPKIDLNVLTSLSESQPLVILETGSAGIPSVATCVGSCPELINGAPFESPSIGPGGIVTPLSNPLATANGIYKLLTDEAFYEQCRQNTQLRIKTYYRKQQQQAAYSQIYNTYLEERWQA